MLVSFLGLSIVKAAMIIAYFMHLKFERKTLGILFASTLILGAILAAGGAAVLARVYLVPYFLVFPVAFALNRLGQHYAIDPEDPAKWGTLLRPSRWWDFWYLYSQYHLEHHYFTGVPFYNLRKLHFALRPFFASIDWQPTTYSRLFRMWIFENKVPHSNWSLEDGLVG